MAVMAREAWTDERLDDLNARVERNFDEVKGEIRDLRGEMNARFASMESRLASMDSRLDALQRTMVLGIVGMTASIVASVIGGVFAVLALG
jgi:uncharacterized protein YPO0396